VLETLVYDLFRIKYSTNTQTRTKNTHKHTKQVYRIDETNRKTDN